MMKQKFWKELKSRLCPRQKWKPDEQTNKCQCCGKQFHFYRRKHHCRFCGKIFCSHCSDLYINGTYLGLTEKYVRHCQFCKEEIQKIKQDLNQLTYMVEEEEEMVRSVDEESESSSDEQSQFFMIRNVFGPKEKEGMQKISEELQVQASAICKKIFKRMIDTGNINEEFQSTKLLQLLLRVEVQCKLNILPHNLDLSHHYMDVSRYISTNIIIGDPGQIIELVNGIVLEKNISFKGMSSFFVKPQVIIIENSVDQSAVKLRFEELIQSNHEVYELIEQKIMRLNPDIIFVEKKINRELLKYFSEQKICVINNLKRKQLQKIAEISGVKNMIKNIITSDKYEKGTFLGELDAMRTLIKPKNKQSLIYLEKQTGLFTLVISQREQNAYNLKKSLQFMMKVFRQILLEKYLIFMDADMWQQNSCCLERSRLYKLNLEYKILTQNLKPFNIIFQKFDIKPIKSSNADRKQEQYCKIMNKDYLFDHCGEGKWFQMEPYSQKDITIGHYLLIIAPNLLKACRNCNIVHRERYYFRNRCVEIIGTPLAEQEMKESRIWDERELTMDRMHKYLKKYKENSYIFTYFRCQSCGLIVTKQSKVRKNYLKNSFHYFLMLISHSNVPNFSFDEKARRKGTGANEYDLHECKHIEIERYFSTFNMELKFQVYSLDTYQIDTINIKTVGSKCVIETKLVQYIYQMIRKTVYDRNNCLSIVLTWVMSSLRSLEQTKNNNGEAKVIQRLERYKKLFKIMENIEVYLKDLSQKELNQEIGIGTDWTFFMREIAKIDSVLKGAIDIMIRFEAKIKKKMIKHDTSQITSKSEEEPSVLPVPSQEQLIIDTFFTDKLWKKKSQGDLNDLSERTFLDIDKNGQYRSSRDASQQNDSRWEHSSNLTRKTLAVPSNLKNIETNQILKNFTEEMKKRRYQLKRGQFVYFNYHSLKDHISILAFALASYEFTDQVESSSMLSNVQTKVNITVSKSLSTNWDLKKQIDDLKQKQLGNQDPEKQTYEIIAYYHKQFEAIRQDEGISYEMFVRSLTSAEQWQISGGKSNSMFAKSNDSLLVVKTIKDEEFVEFQKFASEYIQHLKAAKSKGKGSNLTTIYGLYQLAVKGMSFKCIVMQNLFFNMEDVNKKVYDLKGSEINRLKIPQMWDMKYTGWDTNFKIDKNFHPYILEEDVYRKFYGALEEDIAFLCKNQVIDYSLLVIEYEKSLRIAIIDFMRPYHFKQMVEHRFKELKYGQDPTVLPPIQYSNRFLSAIKKYFMPKAFQAPPY